MDVTASPQVGVVLKTTSEHLDWHLDLTEYRSAKSRLFDKQGAQDTLIYNADSEGARQVAQGGGAKRLAFSLEAPIADGVFFDGVRLMLSENGRRSPLNISISKLRLPGKFNLENIAAAALAAIAAGASPDAVGAAAEAFEGLPHRLQFVTQSGNVRFFNDSYATRPDATLGAIAAFENTPLALILGGSEKFADFGELAERLRRHPTVRYAALIGQTAKRLYDALLGAGGCGFPVHIHEGLEDATRAALKALAPNGGVLLLSPACASFGLFPNYKVRGERFVALVHSLTDEP
jgi:UDP-N-acetylmuramoylalanine--D-glutamate ligase